MAIIPPVIVVMEKACRSAAKGLVRDFGEIEKLQISKKDKNDFVSSADLKASQTISYHLEKDRPDFLQIDEESYSDHDAEKLFESLAHKSQFVSPGLKQHLQLASPGKFKSLANLNASPEPLNLP